MNNNSPPHSSQSLNLFSHIWHSSNDNLTPPLPLTSLVSYNFSSTTTSPKLFSHSKTTLLNRLRFLASQYHHHPYTPTHLPPNLTPQPIPPNPPTHQRRNLSSSTPSAVDAPATPSSPPGKSANLTCTNSQAPKSSLFGPTLTLKPTFSPTRPYQQTTSQHYDYNRENLRHPTYPGQPISVQNLFSRLAQMPLQCLTNGTHQSRPPRSLLSCRP